MISIDFGDLWSFPLDLPPSMLVGRTSNVTARLLFHYFGQDLYELLIFVFIYS